MGHPVGPAHIRLRPCTHSFITLLQKVLDFAKNLSFCVQRRKYDSYNHRGQKALLSPGDDDNELQKHKSYTDTQATT
jgi:hypothetical protein